MRFFNSSFFYWRQVKHPQHSEEGQRVSSSFFAILLTLPRKKELVFGGTDRSDLMGGAEHGHGGEGGDFRAKVWSMSGGPYCRPKHWRRNTAIAMFGVFLVCIPIAMKSAELEQRPHMPVRPIPSQIWCKNFGTKDDYEKEH
ncbi:hypothetical protein EUTSA_v10029049mg [Eutrema salsugineum]|uniref:Transmembrane protein n=2 Tax=Eutrema salsugineum TaxID=72664 RepID=V4MYQ1_EUTSA|nr:hypothetical protein EUTSA_v10029049mg [Eutrema salsugineum]